MVPPPAAGPTDRPSAAAPPPGDGPSPHESAAQAWRQVAVQLAQIHAFAHHYLHARLDAVKLSIRQFIILAALGVVGLIALSAIIVMMVVFLFQGIAGAFAALFDGKLWLGDLVTMGIFVLVMTAAISWGLGASATPPGDERWKNMKPDKASNASTMAPTSTSAPRAGDPALTEAEFLQQEADDAKTAALRAIGELKSQVAAGVDPRGWVEDHPWLTLTGVAAASFVATTIAVPSKEQQALRKIAAVEAAIHRSESAKPNGNGNAKAEQPLLTVVALELFSVLKPFFSELLTNLVRPPKEPSDQPSQPRR